MVRYRAIISLSAVGVVACACLTGCDTPVIDFTPPISTVSETPGVGRSAQVGDIVSLDYRITMPDGREVMQARGFTFELGRGAVISGIDEAVQGMKPGGRKTILCPPHRHWGREGTGDIPRSTTLTIEMRLVRVQLAGSQS